jgi:hypothetical protein
LENTYDRVILGTTGDEDISSQTSNIVAEETKPSTPKDIGLDQENIIALHENETLQIKDIHLGGKLYIRESPIPLVPYTNTVFPIFSKLFK